MPSSNRPTSRKHRRSGALTIVVLLCLGIASVLFVLAAKQAVLERRANDQSANALQSLWLAEAGIQRAAARLAADPDYAGEAWHIAPQEFLQGSEAVVRIQVEKSSTQADHRAVSVEADYPDQTDIRSRCVKQITLDLDQIRAGLNM